MKKLDIWLDDASPEGHQSVIPPCDTIRFYESSYGGVSVVLHKDGQLKSAIRLSDEQAERLSEKLDQYLIAKALET